MKPLYIWAGGKNKMIPKYLANPGIPLSGYDTYVEPFFGGGATMLHIYKNNPTVKKFVLNDLNEEIVGIYRAIKSDTSCFLARMDDLSQQYLPLSKEDRKKFYYDLRTEYTTEWRQWNSTVESATLYFLMRTGFNGIWQINQTSNGRFATPSGLLNHTTKVYDRDNVLDWQRLLQKVDIYCGDWSSCVNDIVGKAFYFMDPPYRDSFTTYGQVFNDSDQIDCLNFCKKVDQDGHIVMFCNRDSGDDFWILNQGNLKLYYYDVKYTAGRRKKGLDDSYTAKEAKEVLLVSSSVNCPSRFNGSLPYDEETRAKEREDIFNSLFTLE